MGFWARLRDRRSRLQAEQRLVIAWRRFRNGEASKEDAQLIMNDLAKHGGLFAWDFVPLPNEQSQFEQGKRSVVWRAFSYFNMSNEDISHLAQAVLRDERAEHIGEEADEA